MTGRGRTLVGALAVFALAVGVLIGSGPLRHVLRGTGGSEAQLAQAQADAASARADAKLGRAFAESAGAAALRSTLDGHAVALVRTADVSAEDLAAVASRVTATGASVASTVALTNEWTAQDRGPFRTALAEQITGALDDPPQGSTPSLVLSAALAQSLTGGGEFDAVGRERADALWSLLNEAGLVGGSRDTPADLVLLVSVDGDVADLSVAFAGVSPATVVATTGATMSEELQTSTVTDAGSFYGAWAVAAALVAAAGGSTGHYDASDAPGLIADLN